MLKQADILLKDNKLQITGDLCFDNIMSVYNKSLPYIEKLPELHFDFSGVNSSDSSSLALIIEWVKLSRAQQKAINFLQLPPEILTIAKVANIDKLWI